MTEEYAAARYEDACALLPGRLRAAAMTVERSQKAEAEEIRLRIGRPVSLTLPAMELFLPQTRVIRGDLEQALDRATEYSRYVAAETLRHGYVTAEGGFRIGVCGTALPCGERNEGIRDVSSLAIRIPRVREDAARPVLPELLEEGRPLSTLVLSPPGGGKTTLLRDLVRRLSDGVGEYGPRRVSLIDERGEVAVMYRGEPQMNVGTHTDVLDACPKALGIPIVLRAMNPQIIAVDEITVREDLRAAAMAAGCGVRLLATIHAAGVEELRQKPLYAQLLADRVFGLAVRVVPTEAGRFYQVEELLC